MDLGMIRQGVVYELGFVRCEIVDDADLASARPRRHDLGQRVRELQTRMAWRGLAHDFSSAGLQGRVERNGDIQSRAPAAPTRSHFSRCGKALLVFALSIVEHSTDDAVMHVEDLIGDSRLSIEQRRNERGITSPAFQFSQMLSAHLRAFASELSQTTLMDRLAKLSGEIYLANSMQPIEMRMHVSGLGFSRRLPKPGDYYRAQTPRTQDGFAWHSPLCDKGTS